jgi:hypothetical protein
MKNMGAENRVPEVPGTPPLFREVQRFKHWIFALPVIAVTVIVWYIFIEQVALGHPQGDRPVPNWLAWVLGLVFGLGFPAFAATVKLVTEVRLGELSIRLFPFRGRAIPLSTISQTEVRQYSALGEYGGWGIRFSRRNGRAYNAYGNMGVQLVLNDGTRILVGSQRPEELLASLRAAGSQFRDPGQSKRGRA